MKSSRPNEKNPSQKHKISKIGNLKESNKPNKKIIIAKTIENFNLKATNNNSKRSLVHAQALKEIIFPLKVEKLIEFNSC